MDLAGGGMDITGDAHSGARDDAARAAADAGSDRPPEPADAAPHDTGGVARGPVCPLLCGNPFIRTCTGGAALESCLGGCEYNRAANGGCFEFDPLAACVIDAAMNPYECVNRLPRLRAEVCAAEKRAFCLNPRCFFPPPTVPLCMRP